MPTWLEPGTVTAVLGSSLSEQLDTDALTALLPGVRGWVEDQRKDLVTGDPAAFTPTPQVTLGAAMLAWRTYQRRTTPLGVIGATEDGYSGILREDPDIARFLGVAAAGRFVFGGYNPATAEPVV